MDPLSILASAVSIAAFAGKLVQGIGRFVIDVRSQPDSIAEFYESIHTLQLVLTSIRSALQNRTRSQLPFERDHHLIIYQILQSCHRSLKTLDHELPEIQDCSGPIQRIRQSLEKSLKEQRIQEILSNITQRTTVLQLSLSTLSLGAQAGLQTSQDQIQSDIRKLIDSIRSAKLSWSDGEGSSMPLSQDGGEPEQEDALLREIRDWRKTAVDVATAVSLNDPEGVSLDGKTLAPSLGLDGLTIHDDDDFDPEPELKDQPSHDILSLQYSANQDYVRRLVQCGIYSKAASFQRKGIELREQLRERRPYAVGELSDMKETLADILLECETLDSEQESKMTLQELLKEEVARDAAQVDQHRRCRLYHKLGCLYLKQNNLGQARRMFQRAFEGRRSLEPVPNDLLLDSAEELIKVLQLVQAFDEARGLREWVRRELLPPEQTPPPTPPGDGIGLTKLYTWCRGSGMDIEAHSFRFDVCDDSGMTPLHRAITEENVDVLKEMMSHVARPPEALDNTGSTPLHSAAGTKNKHIVKLLLDNGALVDVRDNHRMTPLHRCQSQSGGVNVAELLVAKCPTIVDEINAFCKTALYLACEMGNEKMVKFLLHHAANPNIQGAGQCTPLIVAVEVVAKCSRKIGIVDLLVKHGADPYRKDKLGMNAFDAASNAGLAGSEIKRLLNLAPRRRSSTLSTASTVRSSGSKMS